MGKASLESIWNENSNELRINPWLTAGFSVLGRGSGVHEEMEKWLERSPENRESGWSQKSLQKVFSVRDLKYIISQPQGLVTVRQI